MTAKEIFRIYLVRPALVVGLCLVVSGAEFSGRMSAQTGAMKTIVLDPGHGGHDTGISGVDGRDEKDVSLALARLLAERLEPRHRVILSRTGDYFLNNAARVATANHVQADLFVSLHATGGWFRDQQGLVVSYHKKTVAGAGDAAPGIPVMPDQLPSTVFTDWDTVHQDHYSRSRAAAIIFRDDLSGVFNERGRIVESRMAVLAGADMPAVMIEAGCLSRLTGYSSANGDLFLPLLADAIGKAVEQVVTEIK